MIINLKYGRDGHSIDLSDNYNIDVINPGWVEGIKDQGMAITRALRQPFNSLALNQLIKLDDKVAIIFSDITRATPYRTIIPPLLEELKKIPRNNICFFCANGTHRPVTEMELISILGEAIVNEFEIVQNDANNPELFAYIGTTSLGNRILTNKRILEFDLKILTGFIEPHFFAGFSGGGKALIPGMAFVDTIKHNHSIANLSKKNVTWGITDGNPLWEDILEAAEFVPGLFLLNITLNKRKEITNVFAGDLRIAHKAGCRFVKESAMAPVNSLYDIVITSNSGHPLDLNIYQTVKGMSAAAQIVKEGGTIIIAAECWDGIPSDSDYERILTSVGSVDQLADFIKDNESSLKDTWQIYFQASIQKRADVYLYSHRLDEMTIKKAHLNAVSDIAELVDNLTNKSGPETRICVLPEGPLTIPYLAG
jgi:nickel-dependent lactate racemase